MNYIKIDLFKKNTKHKIRGYGILDCKHCYFI